MPLIIKNNVSKYENLYSSGHNHNYPNLDFVRLERKFLRNKTHNKILDYGFGSGENIIHLIKNNYDVYGIETSKSAIDLVKKKINSINKKKYNKKLILLREQDKKLKFENDFFDSIACISVISLLQSKKNIQILINEFYRILKPGGKLLIDMNGPKGDFKKGGKFINEDEYEYNLQNKRKIKIYAPKNIQSFKKIFEKFKIIELGEVYFKYFEFRNHEFIACLEKPLGEKPSKIFK